MMEKENVDWNQYLPDETDNGERVVSEVSLGDGAEDIADQPNTIGTKYINTSRTVQYADWYATSYNSKFPSYANYGGDCQNFASQCVWYGLGGTDTVAKISSHAVPMVYSGSNAIKWYCGNTYWDYDPLKHWTVVGDFQDMIADSTSGQHGLYGTVWFGYQYASVGDVLAVDRSGREVFAVDRSAGNGIIVRWHSQRGGKVWHIVRNADRKSRKMRSSVRSAARRFTQEKRGCSRILLRAKRKSGSHY